MKGFEDVTVSWAGEDYTIPANKQMGLIVRIEEALTGGTGSQAIAVLLSPGGPSHARLANAFGAALRYAGADVSDEEIYLSIMSDMVDNKANVAIKVQGAVLALLSIIAPPIAAKITDMNAKAPKAKK